LEIKCAGIVDQVQVFCQEAGSSHARNNLWWAAVFKQWQKYFVWHLQHYQLSGICQHADLWLVQGLHRLMLSYLVKLMQAMGFPATFVHWKLSHCFSSTKYLIKLSYVNGLFNNIWQLLISLIRNQQKKMSYAVNISVLFFKCQYVICWWLGHQHMNCLNW
jgi:hypothetical protein